MPQHLSAEMQRCIDACQACERICLETIAHCLSKGGRHASLEHIGVLGVCADICVTSARAMMVGAAAHVYVCHACAEICERCAVSCEQVGQDAVMQKCAQVCRECAASCSRMARAAA